MPSSVNPKLSQVKQLILDLLKHKSWVSSKELLEQTGQKYFDRRIRELRDEMGYDIEFGHYNGEPHYRLKSDFKNPLKPRKYLTVIQKKQLIESLEPKCALCGRKLSENLKEKLDHRIPLIRGGGNNPQNFQFACSECNNQKRSQCKGCYFDCNRCFLAFPEKFPRGIIIRPQNSETWGKINSEAQSRGMTLEDYVIEMLESKHMHNVD